MKTTFGRIISFVMPRPILEGLKTIPLLQKRIADAGDFACFFDSISNLERMEGSIVIMHLPNDIHSKANDFFKHNFHDPKVYVISEGSDLVKWPRITCGLKERLIIRETNGENIFFHTLNALEQMQENNAPSPCKKVVILAPFKNVSYYRTSASCDMFNDMISDGKETIKTTWVDDPTDFIEDAQTFVAVLQTPGAISSHPSIVAYEKSHASNPNVVCMPASTTFGEIGRQIKKIIH